MLRSTLWMALLTLASPAFAKGRVLVQAFIGPGAVDVRAQLKFALCEVAECVETSGDADGILSGDIRRGKHGRRLELQVFTERDKPALRKFYRLHKGKLSAELARSAANEVASSLPVERAASTQHSGHRKKRVS